jgi:hypothetical protein
VTIDPNAIARFLDKPLRRLPVFKGAEPDDLHRYIRDATGMGLRATKTPMRPHQLEGLAFALCLRQAFLFFGMRLGKTKIALDWAQHLRHAGAVREKGLVIAHAPIALQVWQTEAAKHSALKLRCVAAGPRSAEDLIEAVASDADLIVVSWSGLQQLFTMKKLSRKKTAKLYPDMPTLETFAKCIDHCVIDEIHMCKEHSTLRFNLASVLVQGCNYRLGLTGTPLGRDPFAIWAQAYLIDSGCTFHHSYYFFEQAFGEKVRDRFARVGYRWKFDASKRKLFQARLHSMALSYRLDEVVETNVWSNVVELMMTPEQQEAYDDAIAQIIKLNEHDTVRLADSFVRLRQIASGYLPFVGPDEQRLVKRFKGTPKIAWLNGLFNECASQAIIFHEFVESGAAIADACKEAGASFARLHGEQSTAKKNEAVAAFQDGKAQFLIANHVVGSTSLNLPQADYVCFYESPVSPIIRAQAAARPMARGSRPLTIDDVVCAPVERRILDFLQQGRNIMSSLVHARADLRR